MNNGGSGSNNDSRYSSLEAADFGADQSFISNAGNNVGIQDNGSNQDGEFSQSPPWL
jgi:regulatory factor X